MYKLMCLVLQLYIYYTLFSCRYLMVRAGECHHSPALTLFTLNLAA